MLTLLALPVLYAENRQTQDQRPTAVAAAGLAGAINLGGAESAHSPDTTQEPVPEAFLAPPVSFTPASTQAPKAIAVRAPDAATVVQAKGAYKQWPAGYWVNNACEVPGAPTGQTITVENINNGFKARCVNVADAPAPGPGQVTQVVLDTDVFLLLADLAESPVPLQLTW